MLTADHGYAASGQLPDSGKDEAESLKGRFKSGRAVESAEEPGNWSPPLDLTIASAHGRHLYVNGRRKWKSQGGYPTLTHGGLSILEGCRSLHRADAISRDEMAPHQLAVPQHKHRLRLRSDLAKISQT